MNYDMKNLKKLVLAALIAVSAMAACQKEDGQEGQGGKRVTVRMAISSPDAITTKSIGDGSKAKELYYAAFVDGKPVPSLQGKGDLIDGEAVIDLSLVRNVKYQFAFWAQAAAEDGETSPYDVSRFYSDGIVSISYNGISNDDSRDAFCAPAEILVKKSSEKKVYLRRPFAQVNFCTSDYQMLKDLGLHENMTSEARIYGIPDILNVLDGSVSVSEEGTPADAFFSLAPIPSGDDEYITVKGEEYGYINMNYILASEEGETVSVSARMVNEECECEWEVARTPNVPVCRNYKTNIIGDLFTEDAKLEIIIEPGFKKPDELKEI